MRRPSIALLALLAGLFPVAGNAGDMASLNVLGYSRDGKIFAFEEYGIFDGSGGAYSSIYFIDIERDQFVAGTPLRAAVHEEGQLSRMRAEARAKAEPLIAAHGLMDNPGLLLAYNPPSEAGSDPYVLRYYPYLSAQLAGHTATLRLEERAFAPSEDCRSMTGTYSGFTLRLTELQGAGIDTVLHADRAIPKSRGCPNGYRIGAVIGSETGDVPHMAMIIVDSMGFEGNDRRWIAVPVLPDGPTP